MIDLGGVSYGFSLKYDATGLALAQKDLDKLAKSVKTVSDAKQRLQEAATKLEAIERNLANSLSATTSQYEEQAKAVKEFTAAVKDLGAAQEAQSRAVVAAETAALIKREQLAKQLSAAILSEEDKIEKQILDTIIRREQREKQLTAAIIAEQNARVAAAAAQANAELAILQRKEQQAKAIAKANAEVSAGLAGPRLAAMLTRADLPGAPADRREAGPAPTTGPGPGGAAALATAGTAPSTYDRLAAAALRAARAVGILTGVIQKDKTEQGSKAAMNVRLAHTFHALSMSVGAVNSVVGGLTSAFGGINIGQFIKDSTILAARVENMGTVLKNVGSLAGYTAGGINQISNQVQALNITVRQAREGLAFLAQGEIDLAQAGQLVRVAQDAAVIAGINSSEAFERLTIAVQRTNSWMLRNLGIMVNLNNIYRDYAISNGRMTNTLSTYEKQQLLINEVLRKGAAFAGTYEAALGDVHKQWTSMERVAEEAQRAFGEQFIPIFEDLVAWTTKFLESSREMSSEAQASRAAWVAGAVAFTAAAAAIGILAGAFVMLGGVMAAATGGLTLVLGGIAAVVAATMVYDRAMKGNLRRSIKNAAEDAGTAEVRIHAVATAIERLREVESRIAAGGDLESHLEKARDIALEVAPALESVGLRADKAAKQAATAAALQLKAMSGPGSPAAMIDLLSKAVPESVVDKVKRINDLTAEQLTLQARAADLRTRLANKRTGSVELGGVVSGFSKDQLAEAKAAGAFDYSSRRQFLETQLHETEKSIAASQARVAEISRATNSDIAKGYEGMLHEIETAHNLALRIEHQNQDKRLNIWKDTHLGIFQDYEQMIDNMSNKIPDLEKLKAANEAQRSLREAFQRDDTALKVGELTDKISDIKSEKGWESNKERVTQIEDLQTRIDILNQAMEANIRGTNEAFAKELQDAEDNLKQVAKVYELAAGVMELNLEKESKLVALQKYVNDRVEAGQDEKLAKKEAAIRKEEILDEAARKAVEKKIAEEEKKIAENRKIVRIKPEEIAAGEAVEAAIQRKIDALRKIELEREKAHLEDMREARREFSADVLEERKKMEDEIKKLAERVHDEELKLAKHLTDMELKAVEDRRKAKEKELDETLKGLAKEEKALKKFEDRIEKNFKGAVKNVEIMREFGKLIAQGVHPNAARAMLAEKFDILPVGMQRMKNQIEARQAAIKAIREEAEERKAALAEERKLDSEAKLAAEMHHGAIKTEELRKEVEKLKDELKKAREKAEKAAGLDKLPELVPGAPKAVPPGLIPGPGEKDWLEEMEDELDAAAKAKEAEGRKASIKSDIEDAEMKIKVRRDELAIEKDPERRKELGDAIRMWEGELETLKKEAAGPDIMTEREREMGGIIAPLGAGGEAAFPLGIMPRIEDGMADIMEKTAEEQALAKEAEGRKGEETVKATEQIMENFMAVKDKALEITEKLVSQINQWKEAGQDFEREFAAKGL